MSLDNKTYDFLKWTVIILLPSFTTFVATVGTIYHLDWVIQLVALMTAFTTFLGSVIGISSKNYSMEVEYGNSNTSDQ